MGRDAKRVIVVKLGMQFQSTLPAWGETRPIWTSAKRGPNFNPLSPHGERQRGGDRALLHHAFQSTLPAWGETVIP